MNRQNLTQRAPATDLSIDKFPAETLKPTRLVARAHSANHDAGYFASLPSKASGRFDLPRPRGTCYAADDIAAAIRERLGVATLKNVITSYDIQNLAVTLIRGIRGRFAAVSTPKAAEYGITSELTATALYPVSQSWAVKFADADFDGIRYTPRFSPGPATAWALFGVTGAHPIGHVVETLDGEAAATRAGFTCLPEPPRKKEVTILPPPPSKTMR